MADTWTPDERLDEGYQMYQILDVPDTRCTRYQMYTAIGSKKMSCLREKASLK